MPLAAANSRHAARRTSMLLGMVLLTLGMRALIPLGYMPDMHALREGVLRIGLCSAAGPMPHVGLRRVQGAGDHHGGKTDPLHAGGNECPFWAVAHATMHAPPTAVAPLAAIVEALVTRLLRPSHPAARLAAGPPLGPRAPPALPPDIAVRACALSCATDARAATRA